MQTQENRQLLWCKKKALFFGRLTTVAFIAAVSGYYLGYPVIALIFASSVVCIFPLFVGFGIVSLHKKIDFESVMGGVLPALMLYLICGCAGLFFPLGMVSLLSSILLYGSLSLMLAIAAGGNAYIIFDVTKKFFGNNRAFFASMPHDLTSGFIAFGGFISMIGFILLLLSPLTGLITMASGITISSIFFLHAALPGILKIIGDYCRRGARHCFRWMSPCLLKFTKDEVVNEETESLLTAEEEKCSITLRPISDIPDDELVIDLHGHIFHAPSIDKWLKLKNTCPNNREPLTRDHLMTYAAVERASAAFEQMSASASQRNKYVIDTHGEVSWTPHCLRSEEEVMTYPVFKRVTKQLKPCKNSFFPNVERNENKEEYINMNEQIIIP